MSAFLEINSAHMQISKYAKVAPVILSLFLLTFFFAKLYDLHFKWIKGIFHKRLTTKLLMALGNALIFLTELSIKYRR